MTYSLKTSDLFLLQADKRKRKMTYILFEPLKAMPLLGSCPVRKLRKHFLWSDMSEHFWSAGPEDAVSAQL